MKRTLLLSVIALALSANVSAQVNGKGVVQFGLGTSLGAHGTHYVGEYRFFGTVTRNVHDDGAVTVTWPFEVQVGLSDRFSLGLYIEPGRYIDTSGIHPNKLLLLGISPRYYVINKEKFAFFVHADLGSSFLRIADVQDGNKYYDDRYAGGHFRLGAEAQWYFGSTFGIGLGLNFAANRFSWRDRDPDDPVLDLLNYSAALNTAGAQIQAGLLVRL